MYALVRGVALLLVLVLLGGAGYAAYKAASGEYEYELFLDGAYLEGCPYPIPNAFPPYGRGVECDWRKSNYSGFEIGMSKPRLLEILCNGNIHGAYRPPLFAASKPVTAPGAASSYVLRARFETLPCTDRRALNRYDVFKFRRAASALELKRHEEHFTLHFEDNKLARIHLTRYSQFFPDINFQLGETFKFLQREET